MKRSNVIIKSETEDEILLIDCGPWDTYLTITNDAENVINDLTNEQKNKRIYYIDSDNTISQLLVTNGEFVGFDHKEFFMNNIEINKPVQEDEGPNGETIKDETE